MKVNIKNLKQIKQFDKIANVKLPKRKGKDSFERSYARHMLTVWGFLGIALISGIIGFNAYINNSREAKRLYEQLIAVDAAGGNVEQALYDLRSYMYAHMNTKIGGPTGVKPPIQLKGTYERLVAAEKSRVAAAKTSNANLYNDAQRFCEKAVPDGLSGRGRVPCITEYVTKNAKPEAESPIPAALYKYDFASPAWSADTAGIAIVISLVSLLLFVIRWFMYNRALHHVRSSS